MFLNLANLKKTYPDVFYSIIIAFVCVFAEIIFILGEFSAGLGRMLDWTIPVEDNFFLNNAAQKLYQDQYVFYAILIFLASIASLICTLGFSLLRSKDAKRRSLVMVISMIYLLYLTSLFLVGYKSESTSFNRFWNEALRAGANWFYLVTPFWIPVRIVFVSMLFSFSITDKLRP